MVETRKEEIIRIAARLFNKRGYSAVTMRDIAESMNIKAASLYNHISSKQEILKSIILSLAEEFTIEMSSIIVKESSSLSKLEDLIYLHVRISMDNRMGMASLNNDWVHLEESKDYYTRMRSNYEQNFKAIIEDGIVSGEIKSIDAELILFTILSTLRSLYIWLPFSTKPSLENISANVTTLLLSGIKSK